MAGYIARLLRRSFAFVIHFRNVGVACLSARSWPLKGFAMDTVTAFVQRRQDSTSQVSSEMAPDTSRTLAVTATYFLSEEGRKASLLTGGDGRALQHISLQVPANRLHLVSVDAEGVARLKLRPRYQLNGEQRVIKNDSPPIYDAPPDVEDLFREAARNHQLERAYQSERHATKIKRREIYHDRRATIAQAFLNDPTRRALVHPTPTPRHCHIECEHGRVIFDANTDVGPAREVPKEAHRRFRADDRARRERNREARAAHLALHDEKKRFLTEWIAAHGTADQQARYAAGVLPMDEAMEAMADVAFAASADRPRYNPDGPERLQVLLRQRPHYSEIVIAREDVIVTNTDADTMTAPQWLIVKEFQVLFPESTVVVRVHKVSWRHDAQVGLPPAVGILVTQRVGPFTLRREFAAPIS